MTTSHLIADLNDVQYQVVTAPPGQHLILAGAGSGKTRVLVHRIAWLIQVEHFSPLGIMAVTFTNKAAMEMQGRIEKLLRLASGQMWVGTFHGLCHRLLRRHWQQAKLNQHFQILDSDDQLRIIRRLMKEHAIDEAKWQPKQVQWYINAKKDEGLRARHIPEQLDPYNKLMLQMYQIYEQSCEHSGSVDFAELLLRTHELFRDVPHLLDHYQQQFRYVLVDEFQDTNAIQYAWLKQLVGLNGHVMVVGDDDQSIYGWRGAKIENIQRFNQDFPATETIRLEQNYRSTATILQAANALIDHNEGRLGKQLWTQQSQGGKILLYHAFNEIDEANFIVERVQQYQQQGGAYQDIAILYRSNAQSRVLEEAFLNAGVAYRIYGGQRFFERAEIKDVLAYCRLVANRQDDAAFERIVNWPTRKIGERTIERIRQTARIEQLSMWDAACLVQKGTALASRARHALQQFTQLIDRIETKIAALSLCDVLSEVMQLSGLFVHFKQEQGEKARARVENLEELVTASRQFHEMHPASDNLLVDFLAHVVLESGENQAQPFESCVQLMTLHSAKGLEFPLVFLAGLEEDLFPHRMSLHDAWRLEEERRLCYVGMTRAMSQLYLSYSEKRRIYGRDAYHVPSRFLREIPAELIEPIRMGACSFKSDPPETMSQSTVEHGDFYLGQRVRHHKFGDGFITHCEGSGKHAKVYVHFDTAGEKCLMLACARLVVV